MAELVDALVSDASGATRGSSSLLGRTITVELVRYICVESFYIFDIENKSVNRYNLSMTFLDLLADKKTTVYSLSLDSGVPKTTLTDISSGKADILECSGKTLLAISKSLGVSIEDLLSLEREEAKSLLPEFLLDAISEYRKAIRKDSTLVDCYSDQLNSSINVAEVEHLISKEQADRLRARYF